VSSTRGSIIISLWCWEHEKDRTRNRPDTRAFLSSLGPQFVLGHSWGSLLGLWLAHEHSDLQTIKAPHREFVWFDYAGHFPFFEEKQKFADELFQRVLPLAD